jgi:hypothetical protein
VDIGSTHISTARNSDGDWEGKAAGLSLALPATIDITARGMPNRPYAVSVTLTPADGSAEIDYKSKNKKLDKNGFDHFQDTIKNS